MRDNSVLEYSLTSGRHLMYVTIQYFSKNYKKKNKGKVSGVVQKLSDWQKADC